MRSKRPPSQAGAQFQPRPSGAKVGTWPTGQIKNGAGAQTRSPSKNGPKWMTASQGDLFNALDQQAPIAVDAEYTTDPRQLLATSSGAKTHR